jgi:hypothetical protein
MSDDAAVPAPDAQRSIIGRIAADRTGIAWLLVVATVYILSTVAVSAPSWGTGPDRAMQVVLHLATGGRDSGLPPGTLDSATVAGRTSLAVSPLPLVPYLLFAPFPIALEASRWIISTSLGIAAAWLMLPLARRYGPGGSATLWLAVLGAFGTLLWTQAIHGNFYYLAHVEAMLFSLVALVEWRGQRRPWVIALALGLSGLARPTTFLAAIPFGIALLLERRDRWRTAAAFGLPLVIAVALTGLYNAWRFGSPLETGYGISTLLSKDLIAERQKGVFSLRHVPNNLYLLVFRGFDQLRHAPFLAPDPNGHSILLTTPALLISVSAGVRSRSATMLWAAAILIAIPLLLYYGGGGFRTYGYRYALDVTPFLLALVGMGACRHFGALERLLIVMSVGFVGYGVLWALVG